MSAPSAHVRCVRACPRRRSARAKSSVAGARAPTTTTSEQEEEFTARCRLRASWPTPLNTLPAPTPPGCAATLAGERAFGPRRCRCSSVPQRDAQGDVSGDAAMSVLGGDGGAQQTSEADRDTVEFVCPVCLEIFDCPMTTQCGHTFCQSCLQECLRPQSPVCAVCRRALLQWKRALDLEAVIHSSVRPCKGCGEEVVLSKMREHVSQCSKYQEYIQQGLRRIPKPQRDALSPVTNRHTFPCPYCTQQNLDQDGLVEHCTSQHARDPRPVVCPICASMPWGDPNYRSADFFQHLRIRHAFSYDTFVDYSADEQAMIQDAIQRSLEDN
ncbi:E3 ubiquitin-protein ligase RNF114 [Brachyhypopomus gauderio]|uniref:E3 ubiquitin-protein ligase RNF114 n=1 Tax=Brachyhypopomus gauderio TaxID=698409 RepID=UPI0040418E94